MHFLSDFLGNNQLWIVRDDFRDIIINHMNRIPKNQTFNGHTTSIFKDQIKLNCIAIHRRKTLFHCIDDDGRANGIKKVRGCPQRGEAGMMNL
jgi:hypothetical protein